MALKATIYKAQVNVADMDRQFFLDAALTLARHPSETQERMMLRLLAWICHADARLQFTRGLCADDEPELWLLDDSQQITCWIALGLPDEKRMKKACARAERVYLYAYGARAASVWWSQQRDKLSRLANLHVRYIDDQQLATLAGFAARTMSLQATLQEGIIWLSDAGHHAEIALAEWLPQEVSV
ncbi:hypothetical protein BL250_15040 [Erwinia sp. OLTSP20]|uniref:YaeQ family protein n=1 Tax=unclassified Erwinia TaxID=2622719 RepID=UPI000C19CE99|nr:MULTISPECIES: YaeQ family protein [unclassified Erwinia]PIJ49852.1 hypothetical protein BV501_11750 [Erwinia sp. OAMSP11]PIJ70951.1 hypothetical protein BK416_12940 [Erwinia sp. OLSSP12]PIJ80317.1 hypothetical protein BLD47_11805 [Erwinia sp. OLCASP19]PIJ82441.1 hypothetical protein BLD46_11555 [Erwinia sp. OLMTSP26]PIJ85126.1 hypothetical protein BLD49_11665 [Erwinia sp. OLMDSP33]